MYKPAVGILAALAVVLSACAQPQPPPPTRATAAVWCADGNGVVDTVTYRGHDGLLTTIDFRVIDHDGDVSEGELIGACTPRFRWWSSATLCEAYAAAPEVRRAAESVHVNAVHGEPTGDRPGFPLVVRGDVACEEITLDVGQGADQLRSWDSAADYNQARQVELQLSRAGARDCLDVDAARNLALEARERLSGDWPVLESTRGAEDEAHAGLCFDVRLDRLGTVRIDYHPGPVRPPG